MLTHATSAIVMIHDTVANLHLLFWHTEAYRRDDPTRFMPGDIKFFFSRRPILMKIATTHIPDALISSTTSPGPGVGSGTSISSKVRSPVKTTAFIALTSAPSILFSVTELRELRRDTTAQRINFTVSRP